MRLGVPFEKSCSIIAEKIFRVEPGKDYSEKKEAMLKYAKEDETKKRYGDAAYIHGLLGDYKKARQLLIKDADDILARGGIEWAMTCYKSLMDTKCLKEFFMEAAERIIQNHEIRRLSLPTWYQAITILKEGNFSLSEVSENVRGTLLTLVSEGNIEATQSIAELVKTEDDELMFNEARAGLVL
jgi:hypothetical protein